MPKRLKAVRQRRTREQHVTLPWWLAGGEEECPHCGQTYAYEAEVRCADCDAALCPLCAISVQTRRLCPECGPAGKA
jgi:hypothetical protein